MCVEQRNGLLNNRLRTNYKVALILRHAKGSLLIIACVVGSAIAAGQMTCYLRSCVSLRQPLAESLGGVAIWRAWSGYGWCSLIPPQSAIIRPPYRGANLYWGTHGTQLQFDRQKLKLSHGTITSSTVLPGAGHHSNACKSCPTKRHLVTIRSLIGGSKW